MFDRLARGMLKNNTNLHEYFIIEDYKKIIKILEDRENEFYNIYDCLTPNEYKYEYKKLESLRKKINELKDKIICFDPNYFNK